MRNLFRRIRVAWLFTRNFPYTPLPQDYWLPENAHAWSHFLISDTGIKFRNIMRNKVYDTSTRAMLETSDHSKHLCGYAAGVRGVIAEYDELLKIPNPPEGFGQEEIDSLQESEI